MADKTEKPLIEALRKAAAERAAMPLLAARGREGLFPATAAGRAAAERAQSEGLVATDQGGDAALWSITPAGLRRLADDADPSELLEDCVRAIEGRQEQLEAVRAMVSRLHANFDGLRTAVENVLPNVRPAEEIGIVERAVEQALERWNAEATEDCPLPELFRRTERLRRGLTLGGFHDALRGLFTAGRVYLHPWTGPLYELPEPPFALLTGHEIAYYASARDGAPTSASQAYAETT